MQRIERSEVYNTEGGAVFSGSISASRDVNIIHINTIRPIAQSLYSSLFTSSEIFSQVRNEIGLLVTVLNATEEHAKKAHAESLCSSELKKALDNCKDALSELSKLKEHFDSVGPQTQVTWERMDWSKTELTNIKLSLSLYIQVLNTLIARMMLSSQSNVERMLKAFVHERRNGKNSSPALSIISNGSLAPNEKEQWRQLRKELQGVGITPEIFSLNRDFILTTLRSLSQSESNTVDHLETIEEDITVPEELLEPFYGIEIEPASRSYGVIPENSGPPLTIDYAAGGLIVPANVATPNPNFDYLLPGDIVYEHIDGWPTIIKDTSLPESPSQAAEETSEFPQHEQQSPQTGWRETVLSPFPPPTQHVAPTATEEEMLDSGDVSSPIGDFKLYYDTNAPEPPSQAQVFGPEFTSKEVLDSGDVSYQSGDFRLYDNTNVPPPSSPAQLFVPQFSGEPFASGNKSSAEEIFDFNLNNSIPPQTSSSQDIYQPSTNLDPPRSTPRTYYTSQNPQNQSSNIAKGLSPWDLLISASRQDDLAREGKGLDNLFGLQNQSAFNEVHQKFTPESTNNTIPSSGPLEVTSTFSVRKYIHDIFPDNPNVPGQLPLPTARPNTQNGIPDERITVPNSPVYTITPSHPPNRDQPRTIYSAANRRQRNPSRTRTTSRSRPLGTARTRGISDSQRRRYAAWGSRGGSSKLGSLDEPPRDPYASEEDCILDLVDHSIARRRNNTTRRLGELDSFYIGYYSM